ncbi:hypothetical protein [Mechercharimyces sp. CAU 1602]|uniref:hypothetical protein n=1 Tax=Mechercharimyces sp. CAU 1602 TaxID=2973933 RepID=UPI0021631447|nr:hypothetical protein [Mechercharimyces sp. CAU 1602]MCS1350998.1 hypothetical protein [Mechercharimyces sp. CAU 1602]
MDIARLLTFADIEQLNKIASTYECNVNPHSKRDLIQSLLFRIGDPTFPEREWSTISFAERRFLQLLYFDTRRHYSLEDLIGKGRIALRDLDGSPRALVAVSLRKGWLFPGTTARNRYLYHPARDLIARMLHSFLWNGSDQHEMITPNVYRSEESLLEKDLLLFLRSMQESTLPLSAEGAIHRHYQKSILQSMSVTEQLLQSPRFRFGFGSRYHLYPDRFSFIYEYALYKGYIQELAQKEVGLTSDGYTRSLAGEGGEDFELLSFWIRLYRGPIPHLSLILRWIDYASYQRWVPLHQLKKISEDWLDAYYYLSVEGLWEKIIEMLLHLGVIWWGESGEEAVICVSPSGHERITALCGKDSNHTNKN